MNKGSCCCGRIKFEIISDFSHVYFCYCSTCRKLSGAVFSCVSRVLASGFNITTGKEHLCPYESSPNKYRYNCDVCCAPIFVQLKEKPEEVRIRLGLLDSHPKVEVVGHMWVSEKPAWYNIADSLPQYSSWPNK